MVNKIKMTSLRFTILILNLLLKTMENLRPPLLYLVNPMLSSKTSKKINQAFVVKMLIRIKM